MATAKSVCSNDNSVFMPLLQNGQGLYSYFLDFKKPCQPYKVTSWWTNITLKHKFLETKKASSHNCWLSHHTMSKSSIMCARAHTHTHTHALRKLKIQSFNFLFYHTFNSANSPSLLCTLLPDKTWYVIHWWLIRLQPMVTVSQLKTKVEGGVVELAGRWRRNQM